MTRTFQSVLSVLLLLTLAACGDGGGSGATDTGVDKKPAAPPAPKKELVRVKPVYDVTLKTGEGEADPSVVTWTAKVPTSGWKMTTESVLVEETTGKMAARVWVILEQPGPDEQVTAKEETLTGEATDKRKIERVEFSAKVAVRGIDDPKRAYYVVEKMIKYPFD